jgi:inorganic triphosphatase YgiF
VTPGAAPVERELKLDADPDLAVPDLDSVLPGVHPRTAPPLELDATYHDTADLRLLRAGITVRRRTGEDTRWTVKLPSDGDRPEGAGVSRSRQEIDVHDDAERPPVEVRSLLDPWLGGDALVAVARLVSHRDRTELCADVADAGPTPLVELDDDVVTVFDGDRPAGRFRELELEQVDTSSGPTGDLAVELQAAVAERLLSAGARPAPAGSKLERALSLLGRA